MFAMFSSLLVALLVAASPQQLYFTAGSPVTVSLEDADGLTWMDPTGRVRGKAQITAGEVQLDEAFSSLWNSKRVTYLQPTQGGEPVGSALVIEPLLPPRRATMDMAEMVVKFEGSAETVSGLRVSPEKLVRLSTELGDLTFRLRPDEAPNTVFNFMHLVEGGFYNGLGFHRIVPEFIVQGGDPLANSKGGPGYSIDFEESKLQHDFGVISMGRRLDDPNSAGSQFFICLGRERTQTLDGLFAAFGELQEGADVLRSLAAVDLEPNSERPVDMPIIEKAELLPAPPRKEQSLDELLKDVPEEMRELVKEKIER